MPPPKKVLVGQASIVIDEEALIPAPVPIPVLKWFVDSVERWVAANPSDDYRDMLYGLLEACERQLIYLTQALRDAPRKELIAKVMVPYIDHLLQGVATVRSFEEDIDHRTALIHLDCDSEKNPLRVHIARFSIKCATPESRELGEKWAPDHWGWPSPRGFSRFRVEKWKFASKSDHCHEVAEHLPKTFDIPLHLPPAFVKNLFERFVPPQQE